jgi:hypothetical protein
MVDAGSAAEAKQQIAYDLDVDPGAYDYDLEPVEDGVGDIIIKEEGQHEERTQFPRPVARRAY